MASCTAALEIAFTTLELRPPEGLRFKFMPGQFAWFVFGRSPHAITQHPFSFSSSAEREGLEIAVKALGDFSSRIHELEPGIPVYVDGPHGVFSIDEDEGPGFGFIAGGVGVTGLLSMLRTLSLALPADLRAKFTKSRVSCGIAEHRRGKYAPADHDCAQHEQGAQGIRVLDLVDGVLNSFHL